MPENIEIFKTKDELLQKAGEQSNKVEEKYKQSIFLYFIARYFVSVHEAKFGTIPIQVWNEYRNALDHFFRNLTNNDPAHIGKMEGHIQRAVLDILKIYCHMVQEEVKKLKENYKADILNLVDNGGFSTKLIIDIKSSEDLFIKAKLKDSALGEDSRTNKDIVSNYLDAVFSFNDIYNYMVSKTHDIERASITYQAIHDKAEKGSFYEHMRTHYIFYISWSFITWMLQLILNSFSNTPK